MARWKLSFRISKPNFSFSYETKHHLIHMGLIVLGGWLMYQYARTYPQGNVVHWKYVGAAFAMQALGAILVLYVGLNMWGTMRDKLSLHKEQHSRKPPKWDVALSGGLALVATLLGVCLFAATFSQWSADVLLKLHRWGWTETVATADFHKSGFQSLVLSAGVALVLHFSWTRLIDGEPPPKENSSDYPTGQVGTYRQ